MTPSSPVSLGSSVIPVQTQQWSGLSSCLSAHYLLITLTGPPSLQGSWCCWDKPGAVVSFSGCSSQEGLTQTIPELMGSRGDQDRESTWGKAQSSLGASGKFWNSFYLRGASKVLRHCQERPEKNSYTYIEYHRLSSSPTLQESKGIFLIHLCASVNFQVNLEGLRCIHPISIAKKIWDDCLTPVIFPPSHSNENWTLIVHECTPWACVSSAWGCWYRRQKLNTLVFNSIYSVVRNKPH